MSKPRKSLAQLVAEGGVVQRNLLRAAIEELAGNPQCHYIVRLWRGIPINKPRRTANNSGLF